MSLKATLYVNEHIVLVMYYRVESGSDDPDNLGHLGHFFGGSSGSHPQTNYLDVTQISHFL